MRTLLLLAPLLAAGCLEPPTGKPLAWPPDGTTVRAVAAGDLDGDHVDELVVVTGDGVFVLEPTATITTFARARLEDIPSPAAVAVSGGDIVLLHVTGGTEHVTLLSGSDLSPLGDVDTQLGASAGAPVWIRPVTFPGNSPRLAFDVDGQMVHLSLDDLTTSTTMVPQIPSPSATWADPQTLTTYGDPLEMAVAEGADVRISHVPTQPPPGDDFSWSTARTGNPWAAQVAVDVNGDGVDEIVGLDGASLCGFELPAVMTTACASLPGAAPQGTAMFAAQLDADSAPDLVLVEPGSGAGRIVVIPKVADANQTLTARPPTPPVDVPGDGVIATAATAAAGSPQRIYGFAADGSLRCLALSSAGLQVCSGS